MGNDALDEPRAVDAGDDGGSYELQDQIGYRLRVANQIAMEVFNEVYGERPGKSKVTTSQFAVLSTLWAMPDLSHKELAHHTSMDMPTLNGVLKRLVARGLVKIDVAERDKRYRVINLTDTGTDMAQGLRARGHMVSDRILQPLAVEDQRHLLDLLSKLIRSHRT